MLFKKPTQSKGPKAVSLPAVSEPRTGFNLEEQKSSLNKYNENIRTAKDVRFQANARLKIPVFASNPAVCEIGEIALIGGVMKYCSSSNTWSNI